MSLHVALFPAWIQSLQMHVQNLLRALHTTMNSRHAFHSVMRLHVAALTALPQDTTDSIRSIDPICPLLYPPMDSSIASKLARRFLFVSEYERSKVEEKIEAPNPNSSGTTTEDNKPHLLHESIQECGDQTLPWNLIFEAEGVSAETIFIITSGSRPKDQEYSIWQDTDLQDSSDDGINHSLWKLYHRLRMDQYEISLRCFTGPWNSHGATEKRHPHTTIEKLVNPRE